MSTAAESPAILFEKSLASGRIHSGYVISGPGDAPQEGATHFARAIVCTAEAGEPRPCESCSSCRTSGIETKPVDIDGKDGPYFRFIGSHPDLYWLEKGAGSSAISIEQIRHLQTALHRSSNAGGRRVVVIANAKWLNTHSQNALLRLIEEPPPLTSILLATDTPFNLLTTIRSRCIRVTLPGESIRDLRGLELSEDARNLVSRLDTIHTLGMPGLLDWAEEYHSKQGKRKVAVEELDELLSIGCDWLYERISKATEQGQEIVRDELDAYKAVMRCRRELVRRNTNTQMTAEECLFAIRSAVHS
ncbi:MAG: hypothetical protein P8Q97_08480 [Myxococcota bacterium]|jgi:hypothetical protein|nr:hypothetical protein [Myxococcota bacterium]